MKFSTFKAKIITKKIERLLNGKSQNSSLHVQKNIKTVGIIVNEGSTFDFEMLKKLQKQIASGSKNFSVLTYKNTTESYNEFRGAFVSEKDFSWNGNLQSKEVKDFLLKPFDMLIDYTKPSTVLSKYLIAKSKAKFKVGFANEDKRLYDFMISVDEDLSLFNNELIKYLNILDKIKK